jgi:ssDNA thymidine ADP-ribosyltransferase, DarT
MNTIPHPTPIFHITHVNNLPLILETGGLRTCLDLRNANVGYTDVAHQSLQDRRANVLVPCGLGGTLHHYIPFYFAPRSPMLYVISKKNGPQHSEGQGPIIHLVSTAQIVRERGLHFVFTDGHGIMQPLTKFYDDLASLDQVDWQIMRERYWRDTAEDNDRSRRRQAEFLVHGFFPGKLVSSIGVAGPRMQARVNTLLQGIDHKPLGNVKTDWYY